MYIKLRLLVTKKAPYLLCVLFAYLSEHDYIDGEVDDAYATGCNYQVMWQIFMFFALRISEGTKDMAGSLGKCS